jgi:phosphatidylglycerophosphate synthase
MLTSAGDRIAHPRRALSPTLALVTAMRLVLLPVLVTSFMVEPLVTTAALLLFVAADVADGVVARRLSADGFLRRATDSTIDRIAINSCLIAACAKGALPWLILLGFLLRDVWCAGVGTRVMTVRRVVITGDLYYRALAGSFAIWGLAAPWMTSGARSAFAGAILGVAVVLAIDFTRAARFVLAADRGLKPGTISVVHVRQLASRSSRDLQ